jgi:hypothetical protein
MKVTREEVYQFIELVFRWYLAFYMIDYGYSKLTDGQFHISDENAAKPIHDLDKFYIAWYLFSLSPLFKLIVGTSQVIGGLLILIPRTKLIGALILLPILAHIFLIDVCFTTGVFGYNLPVRLFGMIMVDIWLLYHNREVVIAAWRLLTAFDSTSWRYKWWVYFLFPILGFLMDFILAIVLYPLRLLLIFLSH